MLLAVICLYFTCEAYMKLTKSVCCLFTTPRQCTITLSFVWLSFYTLTLHETYRGFDQVKVEPCVLCISLVHVIHCTCQPYANLTMSDWVCCKITTHRCPCPPLCTQFLHQTYNWSEYLSIRHYVTQCVWKTTLYRGLAAPSTYNMQYNTYYYSGIYNNVTSNIM